MRVKKWKLMKRNYFTYVQQIIWAIGLAGWLSMYLPFQVKWLFFGMAFVVIEGVVIATDRYKKMPITYVVLVAAIMGSLWLIQKSGQCAEKEGVVNKCGNGPWVRFFLC